MSDVKYYGLVDRDFEHAISFGVVSNDDRLVLLQFPRSKVIEREGMFDVLPGASPLQTFSYTTVSGVSPLGPDQRFSNELCARLQAALSCVTREVGFA